MLNDLRLPKLPVPRIGSLLNRIEQLDLRGLQVTPEVLALIPERTIRRLKVLPVRVTGNVLQLAMVDPANLMALDDVRRLVRGLRIQPAAISDDDFVRLLAVCFAPPPPAVPAPVAEPEAMGDILDEMVDLIDLEEDEPGNLGDLQRASSDTPIIRLANSLLINAVRQKASDIHLEPQEKQIKVRYRIDGTLVNQDMLPKRIYLALVSRLKIMAHLNIAEKRLPQDGRIRIRHGGNTIDFRVSTLPSHYGEKVVMRVLDKSSGVPGLDQLIQLPDSLEQVRQMIARPHGIVFVTGPTGSGKSTTLYSILQTCNTPDVNIVTAEDPVECEMSDITQVQAHPEIGLTFARILKAFLRQDPDIILIGETRDKELAKIAIESALTGHLVFTSMHTNDAVGAITRLQEMGIDTFLTASATSGVIAQRLVKRLCPACAVPFVAEAHVLEHVGFPWRDGQDVVLYRANEDGCDQCNKGYRGRVGIFEVLAFNDELRDLVTREAGPAQLKQAARKNGMITLKEHALRLVEKGLTSLEEVLRVTVADEAEEPACPRQQAVIGDDFQSCPTCHSSLHAKVKPIKPRTKPLSDDAPVRAGYAAG